MTSERLLDVEIPEFLSSDTLSRNVGAASDLVTPPIIGDVSAGVVSVVGVAVGGVAMPLECEVEEDEFICSSILKRRSDNFFISSSRAFGELSSNPPVLPPTLSPERGGFGGGAAFPETEDVVLTCDLSVDAAVDDSEFVEGFGFDFGTSGLGGELSDLFRGCLCSAGGGCGCPTLPLVAATEDDEEMGVAWTGGLEGGTNGCFLSILR